MGLVLVTLVLAVLVGWALGGRLSHLEQLPYRSLPLLGGALVAMLGGTLLALAGLPARPTQGLGLAVAAGLTLTFCLRSRAVAGLGLVSAGLLLNALVIVANGGMPVSAAASLRAGLDPAAAVADPRHQPEDAATTLRPLGDVIPVPLPARPEVISVGDLLGAAGLAQLIVSAMLLGHRPGRRAPAPAPAGVAGPARPGPYRRRGPARAPAGAHRPAGHRPAGPPGGPAPGSAPPGGEPADDHPPALEPALALAAALSSRGSGPAPAALGPAALGPAALGPAAHVLVAEKRGAMTVWRAAPVAPPGNGRARPAVDLDAEPAPRGGAT
jgi:hypothetical protein